MTGATTANNPPSDIALALKKEEHTPSSPSFPKRLELSKEELLVCRNPEGPVDFTRPENIQVAMQIAHSIMKKDGIITHSMNILDRLTTIDKIESVQWDRGDARQGKLPIYLGIEGETLTRRDIETFTNHLEKEFPGLAFEINNSDPHHPFLKVRSEPGERSPSTGTIRF